MSGDDSSFEARSLSSSIKTLLQPTTGPVAKVVSYGKARVRVRKLGFCGQCPRESVNPANQWKFVKRGVYINYCRLQLGAIVRNCLVRQLRKIEIAPLHTFSWKLFPLSVYRAKCGFYFCDILWQTPEYSQEQKYLVENRRRSVVFCGTVLRSFRI